MPDLHVFDDAGALARDAAERLIAAAAAATARLGRFDLGLSGGRTPAALYRTLAEEDHRRRVDWTRVRIWFTDERAVPPDHPLSNFRLARETLIDPLRIPPRNVHRMKGEYEDLAAAVEEYEAHLTGPIDLLLLGVGEDGHIASIFPRSPLVDERTRRVAVVLDAPKPPPRRLTLTPRAIAEARQALVLAIGAEKAPAVAAALAEGTPHECPARLVRERTWLVDREAALPARAG